MATLHVQAVQFNQVPDKSVIKKFKPLGKNESVTFRVKGSYDPSNPKKRVLRTMLLPQQDVVKDPETGEVYDIAYISGIGQGGVPIFGEIWFDDKSGSAKTLHGNRAADVRMYNYIMMSNYLVDNPNSDPAKHKIELESEDKDQAYVRNKRKKVQSALNTVEMMTDEEIMNFLRANRKPIANTAGKRRFYLEGLAEKDPDAFANAPMLDYTSLYTVIDEAKQKKIISFNNNTRCVLRYDGSEIVEVPKKIGTSWKEELAKFLIQPDNKGQLDWIKGEIERK